MNTDVEKTCKICEITMPLYLFTKNRGKYTNFCKKCSYIKEKAYRSTEFGKKSKRNSTLIRKYGITYEIYEKMLVEQNGKCLICLFEITPFGNKSTVACVDHCHTSGKVRGLLCNYCNSMLGIFEENTEVFERAIEYINKNKMGKYE